MISTIKLKQCLTDIGVLDIIVSKLRYEKEPCLIILLKIDKNLEIGFYYTILFFGLPVRLEMENSRKFLLHA